MRLLLLIPLILSSLTAFAEPPLSGSMCGSRRCTPEMLHIYEEFKKASAPFLDEPQAYSGTCYHIHPNIGSDRAHHGVVLFEPTAQGMGFAGLFSFFTSENPYKNKTYSEIRHRLTQDSNLIETYLISPSEAYVEIPGESSMIYYWVKTEQTPQGKRAYLMSLWQHFSFMADVRIYCDLDQGVQP